MQKIEVKVLEHNEAAFPKVLARLTQRGANISCMKDFDNLFENASSGVPSRGLMQMPHTTLRRYNYVTVVIVGLSTKCASQFRTHAKELTFISTSTQYSRYDSRDDNYVIPDGLTDEQEKAMIKAYEDVTNVYKELLHNGVDRDIAGYLLPQGLRKVLVVTGSINDWEYVLATRLCNRNTKETQYVAKLIRNAIKDALGENWVTNMAPSCMTRGCEEGSMCCCKDFEFDV